jgi:hypothetical protein
VIPIEEINFDDVIARSKAACDALSDEDDGLKREVLAHAGNRWSLGIVHALGVSGTLRHAELARQLDGVTQRMLTPLPAPVGTGWLDRPKGSSGSAATGGLYTYRTGAWVTGGHDAALDMGHRQRPIIQGGARQLR